MPPLDRSKVVEYVEANIGNFHAARLASLEKLKLRDVLKAKNPYLFKAKNISTGYDLVKTLLDAHLSSQEESIFGDFLEGLARYICQSVYGGRKSTATGIDLEFEKDGITYLVAIKSGPKWGNSAQVEKMRDHFRKAMRILRTNNPRSNARAVNGCCYGRDSKPDKGDYQKLCGQRFWEFVSGDPDLYTNIIEPLGHKAKEKNEEFQKLYSRRINMFELEVLQGFVEDGLINWKKLVEFSSGAARPPRIKTTKPKAAKTKVKND